MKWNYYQQIVGSAAIIHYKNQNNCNVSLEQEHKNFYPHFGKKWENTAIFNAP